MWCILFHNHDNDTSESVEHNRLPRPGLRCEWVHIVHISMAFEGHLYYNMSLVMRNPVFCMCENKDADQLRSNCAADQRLCFRYIESTIPLLHKYENSCLLKSSVVVQPGLCRTWSETPKTGFLTTRLYNPLMFLLWRSMIIWVGYKQNGAFYCGLALAHLGRW